MAIDIGRMFEATKDGIQVMSGEDPKVEVNKLAWKNGLSQKNGSSKKNNSSKKKNEKVEKCDRCGYNAHKPQEKFNCRSQRNCPLDNKCLTTSLIYNAQITSTTVNQTTTKNYIGLTEGTFKQRYTQHKSTFTHRELSNSTELSKYIWQLKDSNTSFTTKWSIITRARPYHNSSKRCDLCLAEKTLYN